MIIGFSGHRNVGGFDYPNPTYNRVCQETEKLLLELKPECAISGMALGYDSITAFICIKLNIPFIAAVPFIGQEKLWPRTAQQTYQKLLKKAKEVIIVSDGGYAFWKMHKRNQYIVDNSDVMLFYYNGGPKGGTANCYRYAIDKEKKIYITK